jgi:sodium/potassium-transporting ATPase subunit alpha
VLSTSTYFAYEPTQDDAKKLFARVRGVAVADVGDLSPQDEKEMKARLRVAEKDLLYVHRFCKGDASETGLVQWAQPLMDLDQGRIDYNTHVYTPPGGTNEIECSIPFSSDQKFNLFIRNMSKDGKHLRVYLKGAPERVVTRCTRILIEGEQKEFNETYRKEVQQANDDFGKLGERVLAFAYCDLDASKFPEGYAFDMRNWKEWGKAHERSYSEYENQDGTYPMHDLTLIGVISLNDPPRPKVDLSVEKCRQAGIKVIMVTGDQPPTAAAIANKVNIIKHPQKEYNNMMARGVDAETAMKESTGIVIHGDKLAKCHLEDEEKYEDGHPMKGAYLQEWIAKPEVVFARTTPSQKLLIVNACQVAGHVVAVTGDGVTDSPAIKKADIGIAMGSGSDVAKNAADMLLLDDNFSSIVNGVEEGRLIFDNLKKSIAYTLSSNIPEILPFIMFILFAVPLPLSTVLILCIDLGTDMVPAISFAYENTEADIMDRVPRNSKMDHLVNSKLISFAYLQIGVVQASAGMFTYFYVLNDFGVRPGGLFRLAGRYGIMPSETKCILGYTKDAVSGVYSASSEC